MPTKVRVKSKISLRIDRFFAEVRKMERNAFQNMPETLLEIYKDYDVPYVLTTQPKRSYMKDGELIERGFRVYYQMDGDEKYQKFVDLIFNSFSKEFYLKQKSYNLEKEGLHSGYYQIRQKNRR